MQKAERGTRIPLSVSLYLTAKARLEIGAGL